MEDWKYLLQKEGDRSWLPLKPPSVEILEGRYRVVAHSRRANTDVEIRIIHYRTEETPPKRRFQKRSRRTNPEGLMVVIPFTYIKPGIWDLRCCGDIMSDLLGESWQRSIELRVLPKAPDAVPSQPSLNVEATPLGSEANLVENSSAVSAASVPVKPCQTSIETPIQALAQADETAVPDLEPSVANNTDADSTQQQPSIAPPHREDTNENEAVVMAALAAVGLGANPENLLNETEDLTSLDVSSPGAGEALAHKNRDDEQQVSAQLLPASVTPITDLEPPFPVPLESPTTDNPNSRASADDILAHSLQMAEQILQQLVEPMWQDFEPTPDNQSESAPQKTPAAHEPTPAQLHDRLLQPRKSDVARRALLLTLDRETLVARRGECITLSGQVDVLEIGDRSESESNFYPVFKGSLQYQLRDPQNLQVLLHDRLSLPEQVPPVPFNFSFELPQNCETSLILGEVTLCDAGGTAIATQPFSVSADLQELLGTIGRSQSAPPPDSPRFETIPATQTPIPTASLPQESWSKLPREPLPDRREEPVAWKLALLNPVEAAKNTPSYQPSPSKPLPAQIARPASTGKAAKSPELPKLPPRPLPEQSTIAGIPATSHTQPVEFEKSNIDRESASGDAAADLQTEVPQSDLAAVTPESSSDFLEAPDVRSIAADPTPSLVAPGEDEVAGAHSSDEFEQKPTSDNGKGEALGQEISSIAPPTSDSNASPLQPVREFEAQIRARKLGEGEELTVASVDAPVGAVSEERYSNGITEESASLHANASQSYPASALLDFDFEFAGDEQKANSEAIALDFEFWSEDETSESNETTSSEPETIESDELDAGEFKSLVGDREHSIQNPELVEESDSSKFGPVDDDFQALRVQDRFWFRLNALMADAELSEWLKSELSFSHNAEPSVEDSWQLVADAEPSVEDSWQLVADEEPSVEDSWQLVADEERSETEDTQQPLPNAERSEMEDTQQPLADAEPSVEGSWQLVADEERSETEGSWQQAIEKAPSDPTVGAGTASRVLYTNTRSSLAETSEVPIQESEVVEAKHFRLNDSASSPPAATVTLTLVAADFEGFSGKAFKQEISGIAPKSSDPDATHAHMPTSKYGQSISADRLSVKSKSFSVDASPLQSVRNLEEGSQFTSSSSFDWTTQEIVVEDCLPVPEQKAIGHFKERVDPLSEPSLPSQMEHVSVPTPVLNVPEGELEAGELVTVWVKLPPHPTPVYVKLWIQDRQSRSLLDGPRSLTDFSPNGLGDLEVMTQLTVPFGSLSIRFEAIAIDMYARRESHKVTVDRVVVPPDLPLISLDEFED